MKRHKYLSDRSGCLECGWHYEGKDDPRHFPEPPGPKVICCLAHNYSDWHTFAYGRLKFCVACGKVVKQLRSGWVYPSGVA